jgi:hypothetical protein
MYLRRTCYGSAAHCEPSEVRQQNQCPAPSESSAASSSQPRRLHVACDLKAPRFEADLVTVFPAATSLRVSGPDRYGAELDFCVLLEYILATSPALVTKLLALKLSLGFIHSFEDITPAVAGFLARYAQIRKADSCCDTHFQSQQAWTLLVGLSRMLLERLLLLYCFLSCRFREAGCVHNMLTPPGFLSPLPPQVHQPARAGGGLAGRLPIPRPHPP